MTEVSVSPAPSSPASACTCHWGSFRWRFPFSSASVSKNKAAFVVPSLYSVLPSCQGVCRTGLPLLPKMSVQIQLPATPITAERVIGLLHLSGLLKAISQVPECTGLCTNVIFCSLFLVCNKPSLTATPTHALNFWYGCLETEKPDWKPFFIAASGKHYQPGVCKLWFRSAGIKGDLGVFAFNSKVEQNNLFWSPGFCLPFIRGHFAGRAGERRNGVLSKSLCFVLLC